MDNIDRLREALAFFEQQPPPKIPPPAWPISTMLREAADEIERLRALIANAPCPGDTIQVKECVARGKCGCDLGAALTNGKQAEPQK